MQLHDNPSNGRQDTTEEVDFSQSKCLCYTPIVIKLASIEGNGGSVLDVECQKDPLNRRRDTAVKERVSANEVPFMFDRTRPKRTCVLDHGLESARCVFSGRSLKWNT